MVKANAYLSKKQLEDFRKRLIEIRDKITHDLKNMSTVNAPNSNEEREETAGHAHGLHMADVATDMYDKEFTLGLASNDKEILQRVEAALKRIEDGTFGLCLKTKKPIKMARLKAIPYAEYSLEAQAEMEKKAK